MRRSKSTRKLDVIGNLCLKSEDDGIQGFYDSKKNEKFFIKDAPDNCKGEDIELMAIYAEEEHQAMLKLQKHMQACQERRSLIDEDKTETVKNMIRDQRKRFIELNDYIHTWDERAKTALKIVVEEKTKHVEFDNDIQRLKKDIDVLEEFHNTLSKTIGELEPYERVIEETVAGHDVFTSVEDCLQRCDAFMIFHSDIIKKKEKTYLKIDAIREKMAQKSEEAAVAILGLDTYLDELEIDFRRARACCEYYEDVLINIKETLLEHELNQSLFCDAIRDMYRLVCRVKKIKPSKISLIKRLEFVREEIMFLQSVVKECQENPN